MRISYLSKMLLYCTVY